LKSVSILVQHRIVIITRDHVAHDIYEAPFRYMIQYNCMR